MGGPTTPLCRGGRTEPTASTIVCDSRIGADLFSTRCLIVTQLTWAHAFRGTEVAPGGKGAKSS